jgi:acetyltransferase-like isoleucine patch superfamily enzyme
MLARLRRRWPEDRVRRSNLLWWHASRAWTRWVSREFRAFGSGSLLVLPCWVFGAGEITVGERVSIGQCTRLGALEGAKITIGDECEITGGSSLFARTEGIEIGRGVLMAWNVQIYDAQHGTAARDRPIRDQGLARGGRVRIGDGAWLGSNVVVLQGVTIGRNAVVGANSVVTSDVPDFATAVGVPARVIKERAAPPPATAQPRRTNRIDGERVQTSSI